MLIHIHIAPFVMTGETAYSIDDDKALATIQHLDFIPRINERFYMTEYLQSILYKLYEEMPKAVQLYYIDQMPTLDLNMYIYVNDVWYWDNQPHISLTQDCPY